MAAKAEKNIMEKFVDSRYNGESPLRETKTTEMFLKNILILGVSDG